MKCHKIETCKFLKEYPNETHYWIDLFCGDIDKSEKCKRKEWCICRGPIPKNFTPYGEYHD